MQHCKWQSNLGMSFICLRVQGNWLYYVICSDSWEWVSAKDFFFLAQFACVGFLIGGDFFEESWVMYFFFTNNSAFTIILKWYIQQKHIALINNLVAHSMSVFKGLYVVVVYMGFFLPESDSCLVKYCYLILWFKKKIIIIKQCEKPKCVPSWTVFATAGKLAKAKQKQTNKLEIIHNMWCKCTNTAC